MRPPADLIDPDFVDHGRPPGVDERPGGVRSSSTLFHAAFSGFRGEIDEQVAEGDLVLTRKRFRGVHDGEFLGIAPTGRQVEIALIDIVRVRDARITEHRNVVDRLGLLEQLGGLPAGAAQ
ncbi:MAG TPA: ester cyclase [Solirubrobacteraceae bacterium]|nr:ester cyclase [Solirubrobacteraceae bacterium]